MKQALDSRTSREVSVTRIVSTSESVDTEHLGRGQDNAGGEGQIYIDNQMHSRVTKRQRTEIERLTRLHQEEGDSGDRHNEAKGAILEEQESRRPQVPQELPSQRMVDDSEGAMISDDDEDHDNGGRHLIRSSQTSSVRRRRCSRRDSSRSVGDVDDDDKAYLLAFLSVHGRCLKCLPKEFFDWLVNYHGIVSLAGLLTAASSNPEFVSLMQANGLKGYKRGPFIKAAKQVHDDLKASNCSTETTTSAMMPSTSRGKRRRPC